jgi:hypothetical protein
MQGERSEGMEFRSDQRESFREFTEETGGALAAAIAEDASNMDAIVAEREASLDSRLDASQTALEDAMEADRAEMKRRLKEVYNYNSYEFDQSTPLSDHQSTPYSHEQHRAFMNRFAFYLREQLANRDAQNAADNNQYNSSINDKTDAAVEQNEDLQRNVQDGFDAFVKANDRLADNMLENYAESQALALEMLQDFRDAEQAAARDSFQANQKEIIYAMHIIRYAGGRDSGQYGFGEGASSYYGLGNSLTGIDSLDLFRLPNVHGYAQV